MKRRAVPLLAALILATVATLALVAYVQGVENRALADVETVDVYVARAAIGEGMSVEAATAEGLFDREQAPRALVPASAVTSLDDLSGLVSAGAIYPGEVIVSDRFVVPTAIRRGFTIPEGMHAMSFEVGVPPGVAGFVRDGSTISILAQLNDTREDGGSPGEEGAEAGAEEASGPLVHFLLHNVLVLNIGQTVVVTNDDDEEDERVVRREDRVLVTVAIDPSDAEKLAFAVLNGELWITLVPDDQDPVETPGRTYDTVWDN